MRRLLLASAVWIGGVVIGASGAHASPMWEHNYAGDFLSIRFVTSGDAPCGKAAADRCGPATISEFSMSDGRSTINYVWALQEFWLGWEGESIVEWSVLAIDLRGSRQNVMQTDDLLGDLATYDDWGWDPAPDGDYRLSSSANLNGWTVREFSTIPIPAPFALMLVGAGSLVALATPRRRLRGPGTPPRPPLAA